VFTACVALIEKTVKSLPSFNSVNVLLVSFSPDGFVNFNPLIGFDTDCSKSPNAFKILGADDAVCVTSLPFPLYPSKDIVPIPSLEADLKWLIVNELVKPSFDPFTEKLTRLEEITTDPHPDHTSLDQYRISFTATALTQQEQDDFQQSADDSDNSSSAIQTHKFKGIEGFDRAMALIQRRFDSGTITNAQRKNASNLLYDAIEPLNHGQWEISQTRVNAITPPTNAKMLEIYNKIKNGIDNYVTNNF